MALTVLLVHVALALAHTLYTLLWLNETSQCWDSAEELLALAWNSEPARGAPKNTCGGIYDRKTLKSMVQIRAVQPDSGATETVQLIDCSKRKGSESKLEVRKAYGAS